MTPTSHRPELDLLRRQVADLARQLAERDRVLHEQTRHLHVAQALAHLGSWNWDIASGEVEWSEELYRIFGYEPRSRQMTFDNFVSAVLPDDHDRVLASIDDALAGIATYDMECRIVRPDGEVRTVHCCGEVVRDSSGQPLRMSGTALDITERKRTELALQQREAYFRALVEQSSDVITVLDLDGRIQFENPSVERLLGYARHELDGRIAFEFVHPEDLPTVTKKFELLVQGPGTPQMAEFRFRHKDGSWRSFEGIGRTIKDLDGRSRVIANLRDITERKRTEAMLLSSEEKLRQALQASGTGLWDWSTETNEVAFSAEWKRQLGYEEGEISDSFKTWEQLLHPDDHDRAVAYVQDYLANPYDDYRQEFRLQHKDGTYRWIEARASFVMEADGRQIRLVGSHADITDRKRMEEAVRESEERYRTLVELSPSGVFAFCEGRAVYFNHRGTVLMGANSPREILDRPIFDLIHPDYHQEVRENVNRLLTGGVSVHSAERIFLKVDGTSIPVQVEAARITWNGKPAILGLFSDITERKRMEEERQRTLTLLTNVINATPDLIFVKDRDLRTVLCNNAYAQAVGKAPEEMIGHTSIENGWDAEWVRGDPDKGIRGFEADDRQALSGQVVHNLSVPANVKGEVRIFDAIKIPLRSETGEVMGVLGVARDITTRISMEVELKQSEARLHEAQRIAQLGSWEVDLTANRLSWSPETHRIFEINEDQFDSSFETFLSAVHPDDRSALQRAYADSVRDKSPCEIVHRLLLRDGRVKYVQERCETIYDAQGAPRRSFGTVQDVTEATRLAQREAVRVNQLKKLSELSLTLSGDPAVIFKQVVRIIGELFKVRVVCLSEIVGQELHFKAVYVNGQVVLDAGRCPLDVTPCATVEMDKDLRLYDRVMERFPQASFLQDHHAVSYCGFPSLDAHGQVVGVTCLLDDKPHKFTQEDQELLRVFGQRIAMEVERARHLAERKAAEETLYRTTSMLTALIQSSPVAIITADTEGRLTSWNPAAQRIFGWTEQEVLGGQAPYLSPEDQEEAQALWDLAIGAGNTRGLELRRFRKDGSRIDVEFWGGALRDQAGTVTGAFGVLSDITERKRVEAALRESEERYARATAIGKVGVWELDVIKGEYHADANLNALFGYAPEELSTDPYAWLNMVCPEDQPIAMKNWELLQSGAADACHYELRMVKKDGSMVWTDVRCHSVRDQNGRLTHLIGATVDITERKQAEQALWKGRQAIRALHDIASAQGQSFKERVEALLQLGCRFFDLPIGMETFVRGDELEVRQVNAPGPSFRPGMRVSLSKTYCSEAFHQRGPVCFTHAGASPEWQCHPAYAALKLESYIGTAINGLVGSYGTLCFAGVEPRQKPFDESERDFIQLMARWLGGEMDRQSALDALRQSEQRFRTLYDETPSMYFTVDGTGVIRSVNQYGAQYLGYRVEDLVGKSVAAIFLEEDRARVCAKMEAFFRHPEGVAQWEFRKVRSDGAVLWVRELVRVLQDRDGDSLALIVCEDITEHKQSEEEVRKSHAFIRQVIDTAPNLIFAKDREGHFAMANKAVADWYGTTVEDLIGKSDADFNANADEVEFFRQRDLEVIDSMQESYIPEEKITDAAGKTRWLQTVKRPIFDDHGQVHLVLGAATDITERKRMEEMLLQRERDLSAALQERERISQDLHDGILQSLYAVGLGLEACKPLIRKQPDRVAEKFLATLNQAIGQLNQVMTEVRNFIAGLESQVMQGKDFSTALRTMVETMAIFSSARCRVRIDEAAARRLSTEQALHIINIVREGMSNALRHSRAKQITVSLRDLIRSDRLAVTDDGIGFNTRSVQRVGHGLVNMAARAQKVRGLFAIQSKPDRGTRISLDLPKDTHYAHN